MHFPHFTLYTPPFTLYTLHSTLYSAHSTLYTLHSTLYTLHCALPALHFTLHILHPTLRTPHSTLYTPHSTLYTPHFILYTFHSALHTLHCIPPLSTPLSSHPAHTLHSTPFHIPQSKVHWRGNRGKNYQIFQIMAQVTRLKAPFFRRVGPPRRGGSWRGSGLRQLFAACPSLAPCWWLQRGPSVPCTRSHVLGPLVCRLGRAGSPCGCPAGRTWLLLAGSSSFAHCWFSSRGGGELRWVGVGHPSCPPDLDTLASGGLVWGVGSAGP